jgi:acyl-CoA thioester hydrolase
VIETYRGAIYPWHCDQMGHMNVMWYVGKFDEATWNLFAMLGVTTAYLRQNRRGMAAVQQNISYRKEMVAGDTVAVRSAFLEVREKAARFVHEMRNGVTGEITAICVLTGVHIDAEARKSCPFPAEIVERGRAMVRAYDLPPT